MSAGLDYSLHVMLPTSADAMGLLGFASGDDVSASHIPRSRVAVAWDVVSYHPLGLTRKVDQSFPLYVHLRVTIRHAWRSSLHSKIPVFCLSIVRTACMAILHLFQR